MNDARDPRPGRKRGTPRRPALPHWTPLPAGIAVGLACGLGYAAVATPQYTATAYVLVVSQRATDPQTALGFAQAYGRIATGSAVLAGAQDAAHLPEAGLRGHVAAATSPDAPMISVTGTASGGARAAAIADAVANSLTATGNRTSSATGVRLLLFSRASAPADPSSPSATLAAAVGASAGGLLGGLALLARRRPEDACDTYDPYDPRAAAVPSPAHDQPRTTV